MINRVQSFDMAHVKTYPIATGYGVETEGLALTMVIENGEMKVKPSDGTAGEKFIGFSLTRAENVTTEPRIEDVISSTTLDPTYNTSYVQLSSTTPVVKSGSPDTVVSRVVDMDTATTLTNVGTDPSAVSAATEYVITDTGVLHVHNSLAGHALRVYWRVNLTAVEVNYKYRHAFIGELTPTEMGIVDVATAHGVIYTSEYDVTVDWADATIQSQGAYTGANGQLTSQANGGVKVGEIVSVPTASSPYLGVKFETV